MSSQSGGGAAAVNKRKKDVLAPSPSPSPSSSYSSTSSLRGLRVSFKRRNPRILAGSIRREESHVDALALPLGMSIAAVVAQVLEKKESAQEQMSVDHLSMLCTSAVRESLTNVFGDKFNCFVRNFEKSFQSTLSTIRLVNESSKHRGRDHSCHLNIDSCNSDLSSSLGEGGLANSSGLNNSQSEEAVLPTNETQEQSSIVEEIGENKQTDSINLVLALYQWINQHLASQPEELLLPANETQEQSSIVEEIGENIQSDTMNLELALHQHINQHSASQPEELVLPTKETQESSSIVKEISENMQTDSMNLELALHQRIDQLSAAESSSTLGSLGSVVNQSILSTFEKSVIQQTHYNNLKAYEIGLQMKKLRLKETELALHSHSNFLERFKLSLGISKASFRAEKFKNQLEETRYAELLKKCIDCLVAGLLIMSAALAYGAYIHSYKRISEATASCKLPEESPKSWWIPKPVSSFNSGLHILRCQVQVVSRMLFGVLMILAVAYLLLQRSAAVKQTMPITVILLLLGVACGFAGKLCVETLGGDGYHWLIYWETLCLLHFFSNVWTSALFFILHGPITVSEEAKRGSKLPYWLRRYLFYAIMLLFLPLFCGLMPFAGPSEWKDHFSLLVTDSLLRIMMSD